MIDYETKWSNLKSWLEGKVESNSVYKNVLDKMKEIEDAPLTQEEQMAMDLVNKLLTSDEDPKDVLSSMFGNLIK